MSTSSPETDHLESLSGRIRQRVDDRHWQLFETRLKNPILEITRENYTKSNDYRIIDRLKKIDQPQLPIEPNHRWQLFCSQLTTETNETDRLLSIFHHIWIKNWNTREAEIKTNLTSNENNLFKNVSLNDHDKKIISSILHQNN